MYEQQVASHTPCPSSPTLSLAVRRPKSQIRLGASKHSRDTNGPYHSQIHITVPALNIWTLPQLGPCAWCRDDRCSRPWRSQLMGPPNTRGAHSMRGWRLSAPSQFSRGFSRPVQFHVDAPSSTRALHASLMPYVLRDRKLGSLRGVT